MTTHPAGPSKPLSQIACRSGSCHSGQICAPSCAQRHRRLSSVATCLPAYLRVVPIPAVLARMLRQHLHAFGTAPDGRLFRGTRGGMLSESAYGRAWHAARHAALGPGLAATALVRRLYDLRQPPCHCG